VRECLMNCMFVIVDRLDITLVIEFMIQLRVRCMIS